MNDRRVDLDRRALAAIGGIALAARLIHVIVAYRADLFHGLFLDSQYYAERAHALRVGAVTHEPYLLSPLYPYLLAPFVDAAGHLADGWVRVLQAFLGAGTSMLAAAIATRAGSRAAGWVAGLTAALFGPSIHYDALILVEGPLAFFTTLSVWLLVRAERVRDFLLCGIAFGIAAALRPTALVILVAVVAALVGAAMLRHARGGGKSDVMRKAAALGAGAALVVIPFTVQNWIRSGEFLLLSANGGMNLWIGNHAGAGGGFAAPPGYDFHEDPVGRALASRESGAELGYGAASDWWKSRALAFITSHPIEWLALYGRKLLLLGHPKEITQLGDSFAWFRERAWTLRFPLDARCVLILALFGPVVAVARNGRRALLALRWPMWALSTFAATTALFFITGRHRAPILPLAIVMAAVSVVELKALLFDTPWRHPPRVIAVLAGLVLAALGSHFLYEGRTAPLAAQDSAGAEERALGLTHFAQGRHLDAIADFHRSLAIHDDPVTHVDLANALSAAGRAREAAEEFVRALAADPRNGLGWYNYGNLLRTELGNPREAEAAYRKAIEFRPTTEEAWLNLGAVLLELNRPTEAVPAIERALELAPPTAKWRESAERVLAAAKVGLATTNARD